MRWKIMASFLYDAFSPTCHQAIIENNADIQEIQIFMSNKLFEVFVSRDHSIRPNSM